VLPGTQGTEQLEDCEPGLVADDGLAVNQARAHQQLSFPVASPLTVNDLVADMLQRSPRAAGLVEPCLPTPAKAPPSGPNWLNEIKHDGFRLMAQRNAKGVRLYTRNGHDFTARFSLVI